MDLNVLSAISPIDGRYRGQVDNLAGYFSEYALIRYRLLVEVEYFIALCEIPLPQLRDFDSSHFSKLRDVYLNLDVNEANRVKEIERTTNHDVKAIEYYLKEKLDALGLTTYREFVHFGLTSQDINNTAIPLSFSEAMRDVYLPVVSRIQQKLESLSMAWKKIPMLARTHGQAASPTVLGKEIFVFAQRLNNQIEEIKKHIVSAKFGGATGNFNAHHVAYPEVNWVNFANKFVKEKLKLERQQFTTQIENYDMLASTFDQMKRINTVLLDLSRDMWSYISIDYFSQKLKEGETGSSAMPHKVNPIDFENAEGNIGMANALFEHLSAKLPVSRLQRDLTDSTVLRNIGVPFAHSMIAFYSIEKGLDKLVLNEAKLRSDLDDNWAVVAEAIQTILRREGYPQPYETLKNLTRGNKKMDRNSIQEFIRSLNINDSVKEELLKITPWNYTGMDLMSTHLPG